MDHQYNVIHEAFIDWLDELPAAERQYSNLRTHYVHFLSILMTNIASRVELNQHDFSQQLIRINIRNKCLSHELIRLNFSKTSLS